MTKTELTKHTSGVHRSKWMIGALAAAAPSMADAALVTLPLTDNLVAQPGGPGAGFSADLIPGDGDEITLAGTTFSSNAASAFAAFAVNGNFAAAIVNFNTAATAVASVYANPRLDPGAVVFVSSSTAATNVNISAVSPFTFTNSTVNGGAATGGWIESQAIANGAGQSVQMLTVYYDDANTTAPTLDSYGGVGTAQFTVVPEPSSLGLLALGAGGLLARRRRKAKASA